MHTLRLVSCHHLSSEGSFLCTGDPDHVDDRHCTSLCKSFLAEGEHADPVTSFSILSNNIQTHMVAEYDCEHRRKQTQRGLGTQLKIMEEGTLPHNVASHF